MVGPAAVSLLIAALMGAGALASYGFAWYSWRRADHPISDRFALLMVADGSWALFALLGHVSPTDAIAVLWRVPFTASAVAASVFWLLFVVEYTGDSEWVPDAAVSGYAGAGAVYIALFALNPGNVAYAPSGVARYGLLRLPYPEPGPLVLAFSLVTYLGLGLSFGLLGRFLLRTRNLYRKQAAIIFTSTFLILVATGFYVTGLSLHPRLDLTPIFFTVQAVGIGVALYRYNFLDVEPMAAHTLLEEMDDPVFVVDTDGRLVDWNEAAAEYLDATRDHYSVDDIRIPDIGTALTATDGGPPDDTTTVSMTDSGELVTFDVRTTPIEDRYDIVRGSAVVLRDITEQEERKRALETQNERLEEFTGVVSHDLRNPLQVIDSRIELARQTGDLSHLDDASEATQRMAALLDDLLELARDGQVLDETTEVDLADCVADAWASVDAPAATLRVTTDRTILADESRLLQVFENLLRNAIDHGRDDVTITVGDTDNGFYVADDGPGIPPDRRDAVFDLGTTASTGGSGFGLAIVERIVEAHGWSVTVAESDDGGARFTISLANRDPPAVDD